MNQTIELSHVSGERHVIVSPTPHPVLPVPRSVLTTLLLVAELMTMTVLRGLGVSALTF